MGVLALANESHFTQPCDQLVKKSFKNGGRALRDSFTGEVIFDHLLVTLNPFWWSYGYKQISSDVITKSFEETGLYPFQADFGYMYPSQMGSAPADAKEKIEELRVTKVAQRLPNVMKIQSNVDTCRLYAKLFRAA